MTEEGWLACVDPNPMLDFIDGKVSERKLYLFVMACCRQIWQHLVHDLNRQAIESAERLVEGQSTREELESVLLRAESVISTLQASAPHSPRRILEIRAATAATHAAKSDYTYLSFPDPTAYARGIAQEVTSTACWAAGIDGCWPGEALAPSPQWSDVYTKSQRAVMALQGSLLLDIIGNPFRPVTIDTCWLTQSVIDLSHAAYDNRTLPSAMLDPARLAVLADALEEAGCQDADILNHLRDPGVHVRGCWVVDLLLGKE